MTDNRLTWEEIKQQYPHQYVGLIDVQKDCQNKIISAIVLCTSENTDYVKMLDMAMENKIYMTYPTADEDDAEAK